MPLLRSSCNGMRPFTAAQEKFLFALAVFGGVVPNGFFLYYFLVAPAPLHAELSNPVALVFTTKAFLLMFLFAWVIRHFGLRSPGWLAFIFMSLLGSMVFSVPAFLYLTSRASLGSRLNAMTQHFPAFDRINDSSRYE